MRSFTVDHSLHGKEVTKAISAVFKHVPKNSLYKALRQKDIKIDGQRIREDIKVYEGQTVEVFIADPILLGENTGAGFTVVFEDENLIIVDKENGVPVQPGDQPNGSSLVERVGKHIGAKPLLCHRLDRNTSGLVMLAKNKPSYDFIYDKLKNNQILKTYYCLAVGRLPKVEGELRAYIAKHKEKGLVYVSDKKTGNAKEAVTRFKVKNTYKRQGVTLSFLEIQLLTGRTHQIRAHLAYEGFPILGDGKYGDNEVNRKLKKQYQCLHAYQLSFQFTDSSGQLGYLRGKTYTSPRFITFE